MEQVQKPDASRKQIAKMLAQTSYVPKASTRKDKDGMPIVKDQRGDD